ncbi:MAG TPA: class I tRNA ligase family protein, partial [Acidobacteriota bacterium]
DIIFFWVARMIMFGLEFMQDVPFREVYIHGLVRDEKGQKMTKSKGNTLDPMDLIDEYGADALRFTLAVLSSPTADIPLAPKRIQGYKAFINKLWNSVRFALMKVDAEEDLTPLPENLWDLGDRWIYSRFQQVAKEINDDLKDYRFDLAANTAYQFLWHEFCDWYIEWIKPHISDDAAHASAKKGLLLQRIGDVLRLLHPFIPYVTEYLWQQLPERARSRDALMVSPYPLLREEAVNPELESRFQFLMDLISKIRQMRTEMNIEPAKKIHVLLQCASGEDLIREQQKEILLLTRSEKIDFVREFPSGLHLARGVIKGCEIAIDLAGVLDLSIEKERLGKELRRIEADLQQVERKLANENFLRNAPPEVVEEQKSKFVDLSSRKQRTEEHLKVLQ